MASFDAQPVTAASSLGFSFSSDVRVADPFTATNITWVEIENSTASEWGGFMVSLGLRVQYGIFLVATGAAASETIIASMPASAAYSASFNMYVPITIPSGTRVAVGCSTNAAATIKGQIEGIPSSSFDTTPSFTILESGPYDLSNSSTNYGKGTIVDPGATANTKGSYTEISQSGTNSGNNVLQGSSLGQTYDYFGFLLTEDFNAANTTQDRLWDVATGAAASEVIFAPDLYDSVLGAEFGSASGIVHWDPLGKTTGTRISARMQSSITDATDRLGGVILLGLR